MKQVIFMVAATLLGTAGVYLISPFLGVFVYYLFAVLRPQFMWAWSLPEGISWSFYVGCSTLLAGVVVRFGALRKVGEDGRPLPLPRLSRSHVWVLAFGAWVLLTYFTAQNREAAEFWAIEYLKIFLMFAVSASLITSLTQVWALLVMAATVLAYISYEVNYLYLVNNYLGIYRNGYGGLDNNGAGLMLALGAPLCWFAFESMTRWWRWLFVAMIPVIIHAVLMTYSRGAMVSLLGVCPVLWLRSRSRRVLTLFAVVLAFGVIPVLAGKEIRERFLTLNDTEIDASANSRRDSWKAAIRIAWDYPIFGVGIRNANLLSHMYGADMEGRTIHSNYLQIAADSGFVGMGLFLAALGSCWRSTVRCRRSVAGRDDVEARRVRAVASGVESSMLVFCIGSVFLSVEVFELPYLLLLLAAQLGVVSRAAGGRAGEPAGAAGEEADARPAPDLAAASPSPTWSTPTCSSLTR